MEGSAKGEPGRASFGGVFRDERGTWILGYTRKLESADSLEAEIWGIYCGLTIIF
ncbi:hypothetical protein ACSBR2_029368 [Camellia fascicularis]